MHHGVDADSPLRLKAGIQVHDGRALVWVIQRVSASRVIARAVMADTDTKAKIIKPLVFFFIEQRAIGDDVEVSLRVQLTQPFGQRFEGLPIHERLTTPKLNALRGVGQRAC